MPCWSEKGLDKNTNVRYFRSMPRPSSRQQILDTAVQLASVQGLDGLSIGGLARAAGKSKGGVCAHFPAKLDLQLAVVERAAELFQQSAVQPALAATEGLSRLRAMIESWFNYIEDKIFAGGCFFTNAAFELDDLEQADVMDAVRRKYSLYLGFLESCIAEAQRRGELQRDVAPSDLTYLLHGLEAAALVRHALGQDDAFPQARRLARQLITQHQA